MPKIFIVHGQNHKIRDQVAAIVDNLEMTPYILEKDTEAGSTIIIQEIFKNVKESIGAIIIATADEATIEWQNLDAPRLAFKARDNVLIETGICLSLLKPENIIFLLDQRLAVPTDLDGIRYISIEVKNGKKLIKERLKNIKNRATR